MEVRVNNINKPLLLMTLYNGAKPQGLSFMDYKLGTINKNEANELLIKNCGDKFEDSKNNNPDSKCYIDYLEGRLIKTDISGEVIDLRLYQRDNDLTDMRKKLEDLNESQAPDKVNAYKNKICKGLSNDKIYECFENNMNKMYENEGYIGTTYYLLGKCYDLNYSDNHVEEYMKEYNVYPFDNDQIGSEILCGKIKKLFESVHDDL